LLERIERLENKPAYACDLKPKITTCETCGCVIYKIKVNQGKAEIKQRLKLATHRYDFTAGEEENYLYHPYYCKIHMPKEKK
ncbi:MAG: hypothetical protein GY804_04555, partial [Alphaproteobacteria bacterium]|nr:hypothetical protein [Alphaproteobacteria bacterium]